MAIIELDIDLKKLPEMFTPFLEQYQVYYGLYSSGVKSFINHISRDDRETFYILLDVMEEILAQLASSPVPKAFVTTINMSSPQPSVGIGRKVYYMLETLGNAGCVYNRFLYDEKSYPISSNRI